MKRQQEEDKAMTRSGSFKNMIEGIPTKQRERIAGISEEESLAAVTALFLILAVSTASDASFTAVIICVRNLRRSTLLSVAKAPRRAPNYTT